MAAQGYKIPFLGIPGGKLNIAGEKEDLDFRLMRNMLESFGEIYSLDISYKARGRVFVCEYYDRRRAVDVIESMHGRDMFVLAPFPAPSLNLVCLCVEGESG
jgi:hypothetical protein